MLSVSVIVMHQALMLTAASHQLDVQCVFFKSALGQNLALLIGQLGSNAVQIF